MPPARQPVTCCLAPPTRCPSWNGRRRSRRNRETLDGDWRELLRRAEEAPPVAVPETLLERLGTYFAFRYLLKAVNDGDLLGQAQFCVLMVLTAQRLTAVCGFWEAVRRLCCEVEHSEENLEALRLAFLRDAALSPGAFLCQLRS